MIYQYEYLALPATWIPFGGEITADVPPDAETLAAAEDPPLQGGTVVRFLHKQEQGDPWLPTDPADAPLYTLTGVQPAEIVQFEFPALNEQKPEPGRFLQLLLHSGVIEGQTSSDHMVSGIGFTDGVNEVLTLCSGENQVVSSDNNSLHTDDAALVALDPVDGMVETLIPYFSTAADIVNFSGSPLARVPGQDANVFPTFPQSANHHIPEGLSLIYAGATQAQRQAVRAEHTQRNYTHFHLYAMAEQDYSGISPPPPYSTPWPVTFGKANDPDPNLRFYQNGDLMVPFLQELIDDGLAPVLWIFPWNAPTFHAAAPTSDNAAKAAYYTNVLDALITPALDAKVSSYVLGSSALFFLDTITGAIDAVIHLVGNHLRTLTSKPLGIEPRSIEVSGAGNYGVLETYESWVDYHVLFYGNGKDAAIITTNTTEHLDLLANPNHPETFTPARTFLNGPTYSGSKANIKVIAGQTTKAPGPESNGDTLGDAAIAADARMTSFGFMNGGTPLAGGAAIKRIVDSIIYSGINVRTKVYKNLSGAGQLRNAWALPHPPALIFGTTQMDDPTQVPNPSPDAQFEFGVATTNPLKQQCYSWGASSSMPGGHPTSFITDTALSVQTDLDTGEPNGRFIVLQNPVNGGIDYTEPQSPLTDNHHIALVYIDGMQANSGIAPGPTATGSWIFTGPGWPVDHAGLLATSTNTVGQANNNNAQAGGHAWGLVVPGDLNQQNLTNGMHYQSAIPITNARSNARSDVVLELKQEDGSDGLEMTYTGLHAQGIEFNVTKANFTVAPLIIWWAVRKRPPAIATVFGPQSTNKARIGETITILGSDLSLASQVMVGAQAATNVTPVDDGKVTATVPSGVPAGEANITVETPIGISAAATLTIEAGFIPVYIYM